jgi:hypothetical protein
MPVQTRLVRHAVECFRIGLCRLTLEERVTEHDAVNIQAALD